jgi:hypothetical protein
VTYAFLDELVRRFHKWGFGMRRQLFIIIATTIVSLFLSGCEKVTPTAQNPAPAVPTTQVTHPAKENSADKPESQQAASKAVPASPSDWAAKADYDKSSSPLTNTFKRIFSFGGGSQDEAKFDNIALALSGPSSAKQEMARFDEASLNSATERFYFEEGEWPSAGDLVAKDYLEEIPVNRITGSAAVRIVADQGMISQVDHKGVGWFWVLDQNRFFAAGKQQVQVQRFSKSNEAAMSAAEINASIERFYFDHGKFPTSLKEDLSQYFQPGDFPVNPQNGSDVVVVVQSEKERAEHAGNAKIGWIYDANTRRVTPNK